MGSRRVHRPRRTGAPSVTKASACWAKGSHNCLLPSSALSRRPFRSATVSRNRTTRAGIQGSRTRGRSSRVRDVPCPLVKFIHLSTYLPHPACSKSCRQSALQGLKLQASLKPSRCNSAPKVPSSRFAVRASKASRVKLKADAVQVNVCTPNLKLPRQAQGIGIAHTSVRLTGRRRRRVLNGRTSIAVTSSLNALHM